MNRKILIFGNFPFNLKNEFIDTNHYALYFARRGDMVDFVTPPAYLADLLLPFYRQRISILKNYFRSTIKIEEGLYQHTPLAFLPLRNSLILRGQFNLGMFTRLFKLTDIRRKEYDICLVSQGFMLLWVPVVKSRIFIYRYNDLLEGFSTHPELLRNYEEDFINKKCNLILTVNKKLRDEIQDRYPKFPHIHILPNGVDTELFENARPDESLMLIKKKKIVFCGGIDFWVDCELLYQIASRLRDMIFVIIGPARVSIKRLISLLNVIYLGPKSYAEIPSLLKACDIGIIPFKKERLTEYVERPLKYYEYLAAGLPVVATGIAKSDDNNPYFRSFRDKELLIEYLDTTDIIPPQEREKVRATIYQNSWKYILDMMERFITEASERI